MAEDLGSGVLLEATTEGSGTGNYDSFLRIQATNIEQGFNTDQNGNVLDNKASFTHDLQYGNMQSITVDGIAYIEFRLDLNESNNAVNGDITLTGLDIYISNAGATLADYNAGFTTGFTGIFHLGPDELLIDSNHGSGTDDYRVLVPVSLFAGAGATDGSYVTLFSSFSGSNGGFEEWRTLTTPGTGTDTPGIAIDKVTVDGAVKDDGLKILTGEAISWQYTVSNTGNVALSNIGVIDSHGVIVTPELSGGFNVGDINHNGLLDTTETWSFTGSGTAITGAYANVGTVTGSAGAVIVTDSDGSNYFGADPQISIDKVTVDGAVKGDNLTILTGEAISWEYTVTNAGNVALSGVTVSDNVAGVSPVAVVGNGHVTNIGDSNDNNKLDVGEVWKFLATGTSVTGPYSNTGSATGSFTDDAGHTRSDTATDDSGYTGADPQISIDKVTVDGAAKGDNLTILTGEAISWEYTVTNAGDVALSGVTVSDNVAGVAPVAVVGNGHVTNIGDSNDNNKLDVGEVWKFLATGTSVTGPYSNTGSATGSFTDDAGHTRSDTATDDSGYTGADPQISIDKVTVDGAVKGDNLTILTGEAISWEYTVTNAGNVALSGVTVSDDVAGVSPVAVVGNGHVTNIGDSNDNDKLDVGEVWKFLATGTSVTGPYSNTGSATGSFTDDAGHTRSDTATDDSGYTGADPQISIDKVTVDGAAKGDNLTILTGEAISWEYTVTNAGNVALSGVTVSDNVAGVAPVAVVGNGHVTNIGDSNDNDKLDVGEVWKFLATGTSVTGPYSNTGSATGSFTDDAGHIRSDTATDDSGYFGADPHITLDKKTNGVDHGLDIFQGQPVTWTYDVKNDGNVALANPVVTDDNGTVGTGDDFHPTAILSGLFNSGDANTNGVLDIGETWHYKATGTAQLGGYVNNATATTDPYADTAGHSVIPTGTDNSDYEGFSNKALTQGFWGSHTDAWDNVANNEGNPTKSAVASGVLSSLDVNPRTDGNLLLGDSNGDGIANDAHNLLISISLAKAIESSSTGGDARVIMLQQAIATQLNIDNHVGQPNNLIDEAVMWLKGQGAWAGLGVNVDGNNDGIVDQSGNALAGNAVKTNTNAWTKYVDVTDAGSGITDWNGGKEADGEGLKNALMWFNQDQLVTSGPGGHVAWFDGTNIIDEHPNTLDQFWLTLHEVGGLTGIA
ncbi:beta strand repeat-containing protein [Mesorhizobium calcicola]|uniref:Beta strand repeat-containing protein n=1 Tax=Mesorhizobium calcicola TaxID=1300310 RepID=A0ABW4WFN3_9HYPH